MRRARSTTQPSASTVWRSCGRDSGGREHEPPFTAWAPSALTLHEGEPLDGQTRVEMESTFGIDFGQFRVHSNAEAVLSAESIGANAYTRGDRIVFGPGNYRPSTTAGRRLLAHELGHVVEQSGQGPMVQRDAKDDEAKAKAEKEAQDLEKQILAHSEYKKLSSGSQAKVWMVFSLAKKTPAGTSKGQRHYFLKNMLLLLDTAFNGKSTGKEEYGCSPEVEKKNREAVEKAVKSETQFENPFASLEEDVVATGTKKVTRFGQGSKKFLVDRSDPRNLRVQMKVKLNGKPEEVESIKKLEDAIEWSSHTKGYWLDIVFVDKAGPDVFEFSVKFCEWANSGNWASGPTTLSHEVHHALGLPDRYDYIEAHAANKDMDRPMRVHWFLQQMYKAQSVRDPHSKMARNTNPLLAEDVCAVAFPAGKERNDCIQARKDLDPAGVPPL